MWGAASNYSSEAEDSGTIDGFRVTSQTELTPLWRTSWSEWTQLIFRVKQLAQYG